MAKKWTCEICDQNTDFMAIQYRNKPFIDGQNYSRMCFGCSFVPKRFVQVYDTEGNVEDELGPFFDHRHLATPEELVEAGTCDTAKEAHKCVSGVRRIIKKAGGAKSLDKLSPKPKWQQPEYDALPIASKGDLK